MEFIFEMETTRGYVKVLLEMDEDSPFRDLSGSILAKSRIGQFSLT